MKRVCAALLALVFWTQGSEARLGETLKECVARYGQPLSPPQEGKLVGFSKPGFYISVNFYKAKADCLAITKMRPMGYASDPMSPHQVDLLLEANSPGRKWQKVEDGSTLSKWQTDDGEWFATFSPESNTLTIATKGFLARDAAAKAADESKISKGFWSSGIIRRPPNE